MSNPFPAGIYLHLEDFVKARFYEKLKIHFTKEIGLRILLLRFFSFQERIIKQKPRNVIISRQCQDLINQHPARLAFEATLSRIKAGDDLNQYQTKWILNTDKHDYMLYAWELYHLHLTEKSALPGAFSQRSGHLLIVRFQNDTAYVVTIVSHQDPYAFAKQEYMDIIYENWPALLQVEEVDELFRVRYSDEQRKIWAKTAMLPTVMKDGKVLATPGYLMTGDSIKAFGRMQYLINWVNTNHQLYTQNRAGYESQLYQQLGLK